MHRVFVTVGAWAALLAVLAGAFGAHALRSRIGADLMTVYQTAVLYHFLHALGLLILGALNVPATLQSAFCRSGWMLLAGMAVFSGSLYLLALSGWYWPGMLTPFGGVLLVTGWAQLALAARRLRAPHADQDR